MNNGPLSYRTARRTPLNIQPEQGSSLARFAIRGDHLYTVIDRNDVHDVSDVNQPRKVNQVSVGAQIETIFPRLDNLFIGSRGAYLFTASLSLRNPGFYLSYDPVVADERYAYITL